MRLVISTSKIDDAAFLAKKLIEEHLAACVNVVPGIKSFYIWDDKLEEESEALLLIKTTAAHVEQLTARLRELHPYEVPEIISIEIAKGEGNPDYLNWVKEQVVPHRRAH